MAVTLLWGADELSAKKALEQPAALLQQGFAQRALGLQRWTQADAKPTEAAALRSRASQHFEKAATQFAAASATYAEHHKGHEPRADEPLSPEFEGAACARCGQAEMELRLGKTVAARATLAPVLNEPLWKRSRYRGLGLYYHGFASFLLKDYLAAGRSLNQLAPFTDPTFGIHAQYLLARVLHLGEEHPEAMAHYEGVLANFEMQKKQAAEALKLPEKLRDNPAELARLTELVNTPSPDCVGRARFYLGILYYEAGRFADALTQFIEFRLQQPSSPLRAAALLYRGCSEVQLRQFPEAARTLQAVVDQEPTLAAPALFWLGKAQAAAADLADNEMRRAGLEQAMETLRRAEKLAPSFSGSPADTHGQKTGRGTILLELADLHQRAHQPAEAAVILGRILDQRLLPGREEEILQRRVSALNLAGAYQASDTVCAQFQKSFPKSTLLPEVLFRHAENAYFLSLAAESNAQASGGSGEAARLNGLAAARYQQVVERFPEYAHANVARYELAWTHYRNGAADKAREILEAIPAPERHDDLEEVPYLLADCLMRLTPAKTDDALAAGRLQELLGRSVELLGSFAAEHPDSPLAADALLRLALCQQRLAGILSQAEERAKFANAARATYERILLEYPLNERGPKAAFERAKCLARAGDAAEAMNRLRSFTFEPLASHVVAPLAQLQLATLLRAQDGKAAEAAQLLERCLKRYEQALLGDKARAAWLPLLYYHYGVALHEAGRFAEARSVFAAVVRRSPEHPLAREAAFRWGQSLRDEGRQTVERAGQVLAIPDVKPMEAAKATKSLEEGGKQVTEAIAYFLRQAMELEQKLPAEPIRARLLYEALWMIRPHADGEREAGRNRLQEELRQKLQEAANKTAPAGQPPPQVPAPEVPLSKVAWQPSELKLRALYESLLAAFPDLPLAIEARLELAELLALREDYPAAIKLLDEALDKEPPADMTDRLHLSLGMCHTARGDFKTAQRQFEAIAGKLEEPLTAQAHFRAGDSLVRQGSWEAAVKHLALFRDQEPLKNQPGLTDPALLRLGHALGRLKKWELSRQAYEALAARFGDSPWLNETRYGIGWTWQQQQNYVKAEEAFRQALADPASPVAARAQLQIGICQTLRGSAKEALASLQAAATKTNFPELCALALVEAAHVSLKLEQTNEAEKLLRQVIRDYPMSPWSEIARVDLKARHQSAPTPHELPNGASLLMPDMKPLPLDAMGQQQPDRASLDDPTEEESQAESLGRLPRHRRRPAPWLSLSLPDPFELREPFPLQTLPEDDRLPVGVGLNDQGKVERGA
jgi:tetratricopeptide (TPR) repeat protein